MKKGILVALMGPAGCGKSTVAQAMMAAGPWRRVKFAGPLKAMLAALGLTAEQLEGAAKERPLELLCGRTPRYAMQTLGTEWGRLIVGEGFWVRQFEHTVRAWWALDHPVLCDDLRFPDEAEAVRRLGGKIVYIDRPCGGHSGEASRHASETEMAAIEPDLVIPNLAGLAELEAEAGLLSDELLGSSAPAD